MLGSATMSLTSFRAGQVLVSDLLFLVAAVIILAKALTGDDSGLAPTAGRRGSNLVLVGSLILLTAGTLSSFRSWDPMASIMVVLRFAWISIIWFWILRTVCRDRDALDRVLHGWRASSLITSGAAILGYMGVAFVSDQAGDRQVGLSDHPNHLAGQLAATFVFFLLAAPREHDHLSRREKVWWLVALGLNATAMFASGSITGLLSITVGTAVAGGVYLMTNRSRGPRRNRRGPVAPMLVMLLLLGGTAALLTSDLPVVDRIIRYNEGDQYVQGSVEYRGQTNSVVMERFDEFLVVGLGFNYEAGSSAGGSSDPDNPAVRNYGVHNMVLGLLYQAGLPAVVGAALIVLAAARQLAALLRRTDPRLYMTALALVGSLVSVNVNALFQPTAFDRFYWMPVAMTGCLFAVRRRELQDAVRTSAEPRIPAS